MDHFTCYAKAVITIIQTAKTTALAFWNHFSADYSFPEKLLTDQGRNFNSNLIKELCHLVEVRKLRTIPYHPKTNGQYECFNMTLIRMIGMLEDKDKSHWKDYLSTIVHAYNCNKNNATDFSP